MTSKLSLAILFVITLALSIVVIPIVFTQPTDVTHLIKDDGRQPVDIDPAWAIDNASLDLIMNVYETLAWYNRTSTTSPYIPMLATNWVLQSINEMSPSGLNWVQRLTFTIRSGVFFHSDGVNDIPGEGAQLTPQDVEYSFERLCLTDHMQGVLAPPFHIIESLTGLGNHRMDDVNDTTNILNPSGPWVTDIHGDAYNVWCDDIINEAIENNATHVWFNIVTITPSLLPEIAQHGWVLNKDWCVWHADWPGNATDDSWVNYHDPPTSPLYSSDTSSPGANLDAALGTGPYMLDYWEKGIGNAWSVVVNNAEINPTGNDYWRGWAIPYNPPWGTPPPGGWIQGHVDRYTSNYIPEWSTRRFRFLGGVSDLCFVLYSDAASVQGQLGVDGTIFPRPLGTIYMRDWVQGGYNNSAHEGVYAYDLWKAIAVTIVDVEVGVSGMTNVEAEVIANTPWHTNEVGLREDGMWRPWNLSVNVDVNVTRYDMEASIPSLPVIIGFGRKDDATGYETIIDTDIAVLAISGQPGDTYTTSFIWNPTTDPGLQPGNYTFFGNILVTSGFAKDIYRMNNFWSAGSIDVDYYAKYDVVITNVTTSKTDCLPMPVVGQGYTTNITVVVENHGAFPAPVWVIAPHFGSVTIPSSEQRIIFWSMGDCNLDGYINGTDLDIIWDNWLWLGYPGDNPADINRDGGVESIDYLICGSNQELDIWTYFGIPAPPNGTIMGLRLYNGSQVTLTFTWNTTGYAYGNYTISAYAPPSLGETDPADNTLDDGIIKIVVPGDINGDAWVELGDFYLAGASVGCRPGDPEWNPNADINGDTYVELTDFYIMGDHLGGPYPY